MIGWFVLGLASPRLMSMVALAIIVSGISGYLYGCSDANERVKQAVLQNEDKWGKRWSERELQYAEQLREAEERARKVEEEARAANEKIRREYEQIIENDCRRYRAVIERLRQQAAARPLLPAEAAPSTCRDYEADRSQLPLPDREFLVREADRADRAVRQLQACQRYIAEVVAPMIEGGITPPPSFFEKIPDATPTSASPS